MASSKSSSITSSDNNNDNDDDIKHHYDYEHGSMLVPIPMQPYYPNIPFKSRDIKSKTNRKLKHYHLWNDLPQQSSTTDSPYSIISSFWLRNILYQVNDYIEFIACIDADGDGQMIMGKAIGQILHVYSTRLQQYNADKVAS